MSDLPIVVYIDDEAGLCRVFELMSRTLAARVLTFTDPFAAVTFLQHHEAAVVLSDSRMPGLTGMEVLASLPPQTPFYLVTGDLVAQQWEADPRVLAVIAKPFRPAELLDLVRRHLGSAGQAP